MASSTDIESSSTALESLYQKDDTFNCQPCVEDGSSVQAVGYCVDCQDYLCQRCFEAHLIPRVTRKHVLHKYGKTEATTKATEKEATIDVSSKRCFQHQDKIMEYHCPTHDFLGCHVCFFQHQKDCKDVDYIPEVAKNVTSSKEYKDFNTMVKGIETHCSDIIATIKQNLGTVENNHMEAICAIKAFKKDVVEAVENFEMELTEIANTFKQDETTKLTTINDKAKRILEEKRKISSTMELLESQQQHCDLYTTIVQTREKLTSLEHETQCAKGSMRGQNTSLQITKTDTNVLEMLKLQLSLAITSKSPTIQSLEYINDANVRCNNDTKTCRIFSSVPLNDSNILLADFNNNKLKLFDVSQRKVVSDLKLASEIFGVCRVTDNQVAMALSKEKKLVLVRIKPSLSIEREIGVNGGCCGVGYCDGKLVVSYRSPNKVEILDLQGAVLKVIEKDQRGQLLFNNPNQLCINPDSKLIYVSNWDGNNLTCLRFNGTFVANFTHKELSCPWQVICDSSGAVYVCGCGSNNIHQVKRDCTKSKVLLTNSDGLKHPMSICYCKRTDRVYIGQDYNDNIKIYKVLYKRV